ncbi:monooxygenase FAD-binding [Elysia marginata]|uniref:Monooxygenase FAD-binding n=1 Tax=Elysia marginata TaxID=1093978 RepID=A0AAV4EEP8_9GAST|nr:monooxygenase FAD-binding [Elysia marginata]
MYRAVVIGGSVAGLMAAKAIAPYFEEVILLEKDTLNDENGLHKGVGQGAHAHVLLPSGLELLKQLLDLPLLDLEAYGVVPADTAGELKWFQFGVWKTRFHSGIDMGWCYRSLFEWRVRQAVLSVGNIRIESPARVTGLLMSSSGHHVAGVCYKIPGRENADITHKLTAELFSSRCVRYAGLEGSVYLCGTAL